MDIAAELEAKLTSTSQTEESLENPWAAQQGTTMTSNSLGTPVPLENKAETAVGLGEEEAKEIMLPATQVANEHSADAALEQEHLTKQLRNLAQELKKSRSQTAASRALESGTVEPANWTAKELRLVRNTVKKWRRFRTYKMAEEILIGAVDLREANVIASVPELSMMVMCSLVARHSKSGSTIIFWWSMGS